MSSAAIVMTRLHSLDRSGWFDGPRGDAVAVQAALEAGDVVFCPALAFVAEAREQALFTPAILGSAKNASYDPARDALGGTTVGGSERDVLQAFMRRFSDAAAECVGELLPLYRGSLTRARASFRPAEIAGRVTSWRKDDTRLHVDSFPATPSGGRRILRLFTNVNPSGRPRSWRVGDRFEAVAERFAGRLRLPFPGAMWLLALAKVTKTRRSNYDALMLQLHDLMKGDEDFQAHSPQTTVDFPSGSTWMAFTDQVSHAATAGQYQLEQTFLLPVDAMASPERSPLRVLERITSTRLVSP